MKYNDNDSTRDKYNFYNTYLESDNYLENESFVYESCVWCGNDMVDINDIMIDTETDNYVCKNCANKYGLNVVPCAEY